MKKITPFLLLALFQSGFAQTPVQFYQNAPESGTSFGYSLAVNNDEVLASSSQWSLFGPASFGKTFLFTIANGALTQSDSFLPAEVLIDDNFGSALAIQDNTIAIGASSRDDNFDNSGAVYVYHKTAGTYQFTQKITAADGAVSAHFGTSVKISNNQMFIQAANTTTANVDDCFIYIYNYNGSDWVFNQKLDAFGGGKIDVENNLLVTSANDVNSISFYKPNAGNWEFSSTLEINPEQDIVDFSLSDNIVYAISSDNGTTAVNEYHETINGSWGLYNSFTHETYDQVYTQIEAVGDKIFLGSTSYILQMSRKFLLLYFRKTNDVWSYQNSFTGLGDSGIDDFFGSVLASQGNSLIIGAPVEVMTPLNGRAYYLDLATLATRGFEKQSALIYPNPTQGKIYIKNNSQAAVKKVSILSVTGNLLFETGNIDEVSLQKLADGIYFVRLSFDNSSEETFKIIKN